MGQTHMLIRNISYATNVIENTIPGELILIENRNGAITDLLLKSIIQDLVLDEMEPVYIAERDRIKDVVTMISLGYEETVNQVMENSLFIDEYNTLFISSERASMGFPVLIVDDLEFAVYCNRDISYCIGENPMHFIVLNELAYLSKKYDMPVVVITHPVSHGSNGHLGFDDNYGLSTYDPFKAHIICTNNTVLIQTKEG